MPDTRISEVKVHNPADTSPSTPVKPKTFTPPKKFKPKKPLKPKTEETPDSPESVQQQIQNNF